MDISFNKRLNELWADMREQDIDYGLKHNIKDAKGFAEYCGIGEVTMGYYLKVGCGSREPKISVAKDIADRCGVSLDWLAGREGYSRNNAPDRNSAMQITGLSEKSIALLEQMSRKEPFMLNKDNNARIDCLNFILEETYDNMHNQRSIEGSLLELISSYLGFPRLEYTASIPDDQEGEKTVPVNSIEQNSRNSIGSYEPELLFSSLYMDMIRSKLIRLLDSRLEEKERELMKGGGSMDEK